MSLPTLEWAIRKILPGSEFKILARIASQSNPQGICYTGQVKLAEMTGVSDRTVRSAISSLREKNLLHTERRTGDFTAGRLVDAIVLHLDNTDFDVPYFEGVELPSVASEKAPAEVVERVRPKVRPVTKSPSQTLPEKISGSAVRAVPDSGAYRKKTSTLPEDFGHATGRFSSGALKRNARAFNPFNPINPSSSQPYPSTGAGALNASEDAGGRMMTEKAIAGEPVEALEATEGQADQAPAKVTEPVELEVRLPEPAKVPAAAPAVSAEAGAEENFICGKHISYLVAQVHKAFERTFGQPLSAGRGDIETALRFVVGHYEAQGRKVSSPVGLLMSFIKTSPDGLAGVLKDADSQARVAQAKAEQAQVRYESCPKHGREYTAGSICPVCANPRIAQLEAEQETLPDPKAGEAFRQQVRQRLLERESQQATEAPLGQAPKLTSPPLASVGGGNRP